jgi:hypothetical protein
MTCLDDPNEMRLFYKKYGLQYEFLFFCLNAI